MCFLTIQNDIDRTFIRTVSNTEVPATVLQRFPYPKVSQDTFVSVAGAIFPLLFVLCMILSSKNIIKVSHSSVVLEWI